MAQSLAEPPPDKSPKVFSRPPWAGAYLKWLRMAEIGRRFRSVSAPLVLNDCFPESRTSVSGPIADTQLDRQVVVLSLNAEETLVATTCDRRPILSGRISAFQGVKWTYLGKILDTAELIFRSASGTWIVLARGLKIRVSVVRFRPWPPF